MHSKLAFEDKLHGKKQHIRPMMIARIHLQHEVRIYAIFVLYIILLTQEKETKKEWEDKLLSGASNLDLET